MYLSKDIITILLGLFGPLIHCVKANTNNAIILQLSMFSK